MGNEKKNVLTISEEEFAKIFREEIGREPTKADMEEAAQILTDWNFAYYMKAAAKRVDGTEPK